MAKDYVYVWDPISIRSITMWAVDSSSPEILSNAKTYRFEPDPCTYSSDSNSCPLAVDFFQFGPSGLLNMSAALNGLKLFLSKPHFLDGDSSLLNGVDGLEPDYEAHQTYYNIEPISGTTFLSAVRTQVNYYVEPVPVTDEDTWFSGLSPVYLPVLWCDHTYNISHDKAVAISAQTQSILSSESSERILFISVGVCAMLIGVWVFLRGVRQTAYALKEVEDVSTAKANQLPNIYEDEEFDDASESQILGFIPSISSKTHYHSRSSSYGTFKKPSMLE